MPGQLAALLDAASESLVAATLGNPYDSLGEAYLVHGDTTRAIAHYKKSLELNPNNTGAVEMLAKMGVEWDAQQDD